MLNRDEWVQGRGTSHHLVGYVDFGGTAVSFGFSEQDGRVVLAIGKGSREGAPLQWCDETRRPLERQLDDIARGLLESVERLHRAEVLRRHQWALEQRAEKEREERARCEAADRKRAEEAARQRQLAKERLLAMASDHRAANDIRTLVAALKGKPELASQGLDSGFAKWCAYALAQAELIDPVSSVSPAYFKTRSLGS